LSDEDSTTTGDAAGKLVHEGTVFIKEFQGRFNLDLPNGVYVITVSDTSSRESRKFILQK
jgi:hypothetical protein